MKLTDIHGKPKLNKHQIILKQEEDEGLMEIDLEEWNLLGEIDEEILDITS